MVGSAFIGCLFIIGYHTVFETYYGKRVCREIKKRYFDSKKEDNENENEPLSQEQPVGEPTHSSVEVTESLSDSTAGSDTLNRNIAD